MQREGGWSRGIFCAECHYIDHNVTNGIISFFRSQALGFFFKPPMLPESISYLNSLFQGMKNINKGHFCAENFYPSCALKPFSAVRFFVLIPNPMLASALFPVTAGSGLRGVGSI